MSFLSYSFLILLPVAAVIHRFLPSVRVKNVFLLAISVAFYATNGLECLLVLGLSAGITYTGGLMMARSSGRRRNTWFLGSLILNLAILVIVKYTGFLVDSLNGLLGLAGAGALPVPAILQPVGLSFIIFQSSTYLFDLKAGKAEPERNLLRYTLFVCFFPTLVSGPIQRASFFLPKLKKRNNPSFKEAQSAVVLFMWGLFLKLVIADRISLFTGPVFDSFTEYDGLALLGGAMLYSLQIYLDFAGYSLMAIGAAALFGFRLRDNFRQPYLAVKITDFWRRWHISLTSWFTDYLYIPLGGNRKGTARRYLNILVVFLVSGLWHGAAWHFVIWGALHAFYQIFGYVTAPVRGKVLNKLGIDPRSEAHRLFQRVILFMLVSAAWVFFRSATAGQAIAILWKIVTGSHLSAVFSGAVFRVGLGKADWALLGGCLLLTGAVSCFLERAGKAGPDAPCTPLSVLDRQPVIAKTILILALFAVILVFGAYGEGYSAQSFIYAGF